MVPPLLRPLSLFVRVVPVILLGTSTIFAQQDVPPVNAEAILKQLEALEDKQKQSADQARAEAYSALRTASTGGGAAVDLYEKAVEAVQFEGRKDKVSAYLDWKKKNAELFRSTEMQNALAFQVRYILLSMDKASSKEEDASKFAKASWEHARQVAQFREAMDTKGGTPAEVKDLLDKSIQESVFVKWLALSKWLPASKEGKNDSWAMAPGNIGEILDKNVRSVLRAEKNPEILQVWDFEMQLESDRVSRGRLTHQANLFNAHRLPSMQFSKAKDTVAVGLKNRGMTEMFEIIQANPHHPSFKEWTNQLKDLLKAENAPPVEESAPVEGDAAAVPVTPASP